MTHAVTEFDTDAYLRINQAREDWLVHVLDEVPFRSGMHTALDLGCGNGHFSGVLHRLGFKVRGLDLRQENVESCRLAHPAATFDQIDLDQPDLNLPKHDLVLLFGILYHLQSPLVSIPNICAAIGRLAIVSTRCAAGDDLSMHLFAEHEGPAHSTASATLVPTLPAYAALFSLSGIDHLYLPGHQPHHFEWMMQNRGGGRRVSFIASRESLDIQGWQPLPAPAIPAKWNQYRAD